MLILLVDDDIEDHDLFGIALRKVDKSIKYMVANDGIEALALLNELIILPDLIFLDINMPTVNGKEVLKSIKADAKLKDVPVIMYSTSSHPDDINECLQMGAKEYFIKPHSFDKLIEGLRTITQYIR